MQKRITTLRELNPKIILTFDFIPSLAYQFLFAQAKLVIRAGKTANMH